MAGVCQPLVVAALQGDETESGKCIVVLERGDEKITLREFEAGGYSEAVDLARRIGSVIYPGGAVETADPNFWKKQP